MRFIIVTGMSGAGKSTALKNLEDFGYFCVDNLPIKLVDKFAELTFNPENGIEKVALGIDIRSGEMLSELESILDNMEAENKKFEIIFFDSSDSVLLTRYKETRRTHPLSQYAELETSIKRERHKLAFLKERANFIIDTSDINTKELKVELERILIENRTYKNLFIKIQSFGFKYGIPIDSDLVFDVRCLPNPYYIEELKPKTGMDKEVSDYVMQYEVSQDFLKKLEDMITYLIPHYVQEGRNRLVISIGCTGGQHRSVTLANRLYDKLTETSQYAMLLKHRDINK